MQNGLMSEMLFIHADASDAEVIQHRLTREWKSRFVAGFRVEGIEGAAIAEEAGTWLGVKWVHQGRTRDGVDCAGIILNVLSVLGWKAKHHWRMFNTNYPQVARTDSVLEALRAEGEEIRDLAALQAGDIVVFHCEGFPFAQHCGIVTQMPEVMAHHE